MRTIILSAAFILVLSFSFTFGFAQTDGTLTFTVKTSTAPQTVANYYAPKHVLAIWIADNSGNWVKTLKMRAALRKDYLYTFKSKNPTWNVVDAITGVTLNTHTTHTVSWNARDVNGNILPDGTYRVYVEFTEEHAQGPLYYTSFIKGPNNVHLTPANQSNFSNMVLDWVATVNTQNNSKTQNDYFEFYPNPATHYCQISMYSSEPTLAEILLVDLQGKIIKTVFSEKQIFGEHQYNWEIDNNIPNGIYYMALKTNNKYKLAKKIVIAR